AAGASGGPHPPSCRSPRRFAAHPGPRSDCAATVIHRLLVLPLLCVALPASAEPHPIIPCAVKRVIAGDTLQATSRPCPGLVTEARVRVLEIDTPERGHRARCDQEAQLAEAATAAAEELLQGTIRLTAAGRDSFGRILARVTLVDHRDFGQVMLERGLALPY